MGASYLAAEIDEKCKHVVEKQGDLGFDSMAACHLLLL